LIHPLRDGNKKLAEKYKSILLASNGLLTCEISHEITEQAAFLRAQYGFKTPDAIQLSTAILNKSDFFLTNDPALKKVRKISVVVLDDYLLPASGQ
jgi:predicted nucleic acid-binding protein